MSVGVLLLGGCAAAESGAGNELLDAFQEHLDGARAELIEVRRDLHRHPELSGAEERTAGVVAGRLRALGFEVRTAVGGHGVVGVLRGGLPGPTVAFRADMDAVRSDWPDPVEFASVVPGVRHVCGHDVHTTIGLALAEGLAPLRRRLPGTVLLLFQPEEENARGARAMIADGALDDPAPDAILAVHTAPLEVGSLATSEGALMAGRDRVSVRVSGTGDAAAAAREVRAALDGLSTLTAEEARGSSPPEARFVQAGLRRAGDGAWVVSATISTASPASSAEARTALEDLAARLRGPELAVTLDYEERWVAGVTNDRTLVERAHEALVDALGPGTVTLSDDVNPAFSEDFGSFQELVPGAMFFLGVSRAEEGVVGMPHTPDYVADEESIFVGARAMAAVLLDLLGA